MQNDNSSSATYDSALLKKIGSDVCKAIIAIQQQQPELIHEKYRNFDWHNVSYQTALTAKLTEVLSHTQDWNTLIQQLEKFLKTLLVPDSVSSKIFINLIETIHQQNPENPVLNSSASKDIDFSETLNSFQSNLNRSVTQTNLEFLEKIPPHNSTSRHHKGIAVLLLDAENLQINAEVENFLTTVCTFPIQIKIAFANWCSVGKLDVDLHERHYDLIHVPAGRDNADGKMIAFGSSIHERFPNAQEVFVCSSDKVMTNLCNHLQQNGLIVYRVSKHGNNVTVLNNKSGKTHTYSPKSLLEIPSLEQFIIILKKIIKTEQKRTGNPWVNLSVISQLVQKQYKITISKVVSTHLPGKKARDIFIDYPNEFVVHQIPKSELYITLFEISQLPNTDTNYSVKQTSIHSTTELEQALIAIIKTLTNESKDNYVLQGALGSELYKIYGEGVTKILKRLQVSGNFTKFLESSSSFQLEKTGNNYRVSLT